MSTPVSFEPGARVEGGIPLCVPEIRGNEWAYVRDCLDTGWVSSVGSYVTGFEDALAKAVDGAHAVATVNGTAALHVALMCAGVEADDEVLVSDLTFIAPANAIRYAGAHPVFIDVEPEYWQMDPAAVERFLTGECEWDGATLRDRATGRRVRAIVPVDILGSPADVDPIVAVAKRFGLAVVEDSTESLGARYKDEPAGKRADVSCFSFNGNKLITTGGGGMIVTADGEIAKRARYLTTQAKDDPIEYEHGSVGFNYRLTNVQAAIGVAQLEKLDEYVAIKRANAARYTELLAEVPGIAPMREAPYARSAFWLYTILVDESAFGISSRGLLRALAAANIQARPLWQPMHRSRAHAGERAFGGEVADRIHRDALSLPSSVGLTPAELETVVAAIRASR
ncbi:MAG TPA: LegC family aminotransferase [Candidatus Acidoferrales bacterium]|nr:LegC family aminotransferase [Candidatus Acidoferrales bacterium]